MSTQRPFRYRMMVIVFLATALGPSTILAQTVENSRPVLAFEGNRVFSQEELLDSANKCLDRMQQTKYNPEHLEYCLYLLTNHLRGRGYLQATLRTTRVDEVEGRERVVLEVKEGPVYRIGEWKIEGARLFSAEQVRETLGLHKGDIANGEALSEGLFDRLRHAYGKFGYIQYTAELQPIFHATEGATEGIVDLDITVDEGQQFKIGSIKFDGSDEQSQASLKHDLLLRDGDVYDHDLLIESVKVINDGRLYNTLDPDKDVDYRTNEKRALVDVTIHLKKRDSSVARQ